MKQQFGLTVRREKRAVSSLVLTVKNANAAGLKLNAGSEGGGGYGGQSRISGDNSPMSMIVARLEALVGQPVIDQTGLTGRYDFDLSLKPGASAATIKQAITDQLGLELTPRAEKMMVEFLVVQKFNEY